jgi:hypothetical protein
MKLYLVIHPFLFYYKRRTLTYLFLYFGLLCKLPSSCNKHFDISKSHRYLHLTFCQPLSLCSTVIKS